MVVMIEMEIELNGKEQKVRAPLTSKIPRKVEGANGLADKEKVKKFLQKILRMKKV